MTRYEALIAYVKRFEPVVLVLLMVWGCFALFIVVSLLSLVLRD